MTSTSPPGTYGSDVTDGPEIPDKELLRRHTAGDPDAFTELFRRHRDRLWAVALRTISDPEEAADALQDAMISAFRNAAQFRGESAVTTWLHRVVVNACLDRIRRRTVRQADPLPEDDRAAELATGDQPDAAESRELRMDILTALRELNEDQRAAIVLVDMEGYSVEEAAGILNCAPGTIKSRCARGRARLVPLLSHLHTDPRPAGSATKKSSDSGNPSDRGTVTGVSTPAASEAHSEHFRRGPPMRPVRRSGPLGPPGPPAHPGIPGSQSEDERSSGGEAR